MVERIHTSYFYPNGDIIDLFFIPDTNVVTDFGETLTMYAVDTDDLIDIQSAYGVELYHQMLLVRVKEDLPLSIERLSQAILATVLLD